MRPEMRDIIKKLPKRRGYGKNRARTVNDSVVKPFPINLSAIEGVFANGDAVSPQALFEKGLVRKASGLLPRVKILGTGEFTKKVTVSGCACSESAKEKIEKAGGSFIL